MKHLFTTTFLLLAVGRCGAQDAATAYRELIRLPGISGIGSHGGGIAHSIRFGRPGQDNDRVMRDVMKLRPGLKYLRELHVSYAGLTDAGAKEIHNLADLQDLRLDYNRITDAGVIYFEHLPSLRILALNGNPVTGSGLKYPGELPRLETLALHGCPVSESGLKQIARHIGLRVLAISGRGVSDAGLKHLRRLKLLRQLYLADVRISDTGLRALTDAPLHFLRLTNAPVSGSGFTGFKDLRVLELEGSHITDAGLKGLAGLKALNTLDLSGVRVTNEGLKQLAALGSVQKLNLSGTKVGGAALAGLGAMKGLHTVTLSPGQIDDAALRALINADLLRLCSDAIKKGGHTGRPRNNREIGRLFLMNAAITDEGLKALAKLESLELLNVRGTRVTAVGIAALKKALPGLRVLR